ncbi:MAG: hypothetical protein ACTSV3_08030, partial [Candidatus Thorarchaeota archaeon]
MSVDEEGKCPVDRMLVVTIFSMMLVTGFAFVALQSGTLYDPPEIDDQQSNEITIEGVRRVIPASAGDDYVDSEFVVTYGHATNPPPDGMGNNDT